MKRIKNDEVITPTRVGDGFNFVLEGQIDAGARFFLKMPPVSANKRGINDIGWQCDGDDVTIHATLAADPKKTPLWSTVEENYVVNKTVSYLRIVNNDTSPCNICIRVIMC